MTNVYTAMEDNGGKLVSTDTTATSAVNIGQSTTKPYTSQLTVSPHGLIDLFVYLIVKYSKMTQGVW